jgi:hypothetical protein
MSSRTGLGLLYGVGVYSYTLPSSPLPLFLYGTEEEVFIIPLYIILMHHISLQL